MPVGHAPAGTAVPGEMHQTVWVIRPTIYEFAGGASAFRALADAHHRRCLEDPELNHPFSHPGNPEHIQRLADYWAEVFGGPPRYSESFGGHSGMIAIHAGQGSTDDLGSRFVACFVQAADDAGLPDDPDLRAALRNYMQWAVGEILYYSPQDMQAEPGLPTPRWGWDGLEAS